MTNSRSNNKRHNNRFKKDNYIPPYSKEVLSMSITGLGLSDVTFAVLQAAKVFCVCDIVKRRSKEMYRIQNFGKKNLLEVTAILKTLGVAFRLDDEADAAVSAEKQEKKSTKRKNRAGNQANLLQEQINSNTQQVNSKQVGKSARKSSSNNSYKSLIAKPKFKASAPIPFVRDDFVKMQRAGKWGFRNNSGKEVISPIYDEVFNFKEDLACVEMNGLFGYINRKNELVIPYKYECASSFSEGLACVSLDGKCGFIDKSGALVLPMVYEAATSFCEDMSRAKVDGKWGLLKKDGSFSFI